MPSCRKATTKTWASWTEPALSRRLSAVLAAVGVAAAVAAAAAQKPDGSDQTAAFMRAKLTHSQHVLEGLAVEDYDLISKGAQQLALASQASDWQVLQTEDYIRHSSEFRRACDSLGAAAKAKNLDGAALAWMEVTMKCVQCHRYVRDQKR
jgi:hypothetical protein